MENEAQNVGAFEFSKDRAYMLAIESSGTCLGLALHENERLLSQLVLKDGARHGTSLASSIGILLNENGLQPNQIDTFAISLGPGSWTGLRIGLALVKTMAWAMEKTVIGISTFEAMAQHQLLEDHAAIRTHPMLLVTVRNAYTEGLFYAFYTFKRMAPHILLSPVVGHVDDLIFALQKTMETNRALNFQTLAFSGDLQVIDKLRTIEFPLRTIFFENSTEASPVALAACAVRALHSGRNLSSGSAIHALSPLYLRASDPEIKLFRLRN